MDAPMSHREALERLRRLGARIAARTCEGFDSTIDLERVRQARVNRLQGICHGSIYRK